MNTYVLRDSMTMLRRNLKHWQRYPSMTISVAAVPVLMLPLFVYVFGDALGQGLGLTGARDGYADYVTPGLVLMAVTAGSVATAVSVCTDMTEGIINRFRTMSIARSAVLTGHVVGSVIQTLVSLVLVFGVALLVGFRPNANVAEWVAAIGLLALLAFALTWIAAAIGLRSKTVESASNTPMPLTFLPFLGSAVVTTSSMPSGLRWFAENQPFTPINETLRGLLLGSEIGNYAWTAVAWCVGISVLGFLWARSAYSKQIQH